MTRREWFTRVAAGTTAGSAALGLYTWRVEPHWIELVRRRLPVARLPRSLDRRLLVQISDIHVGHRVDDDYINRGLGHLTRVRFNCRPELTLFELEAV